MVRGKETENEKEEEVMNGIDDDDETDENLGPGYIGYKGPKINMGGDVGDSEGENETEFEDNLGPGYIGGKHNPIKEQNVEGGVGDDCDDTSDDQHLSLRMCDLELGLESMKLVDSNGEAEQGR